MSQLAFCFDIEVPPSPVVRRSPVKAGRKMSRQLGEPYYPFNAAVARKTILERLRLGAGEWVNKRRIFEACGMPPSDVVALVRRMKAEGLVQIGEKYWPGDRYRISKEAVQ